MTRIAAQLAAVIGGVAYQSVSEVVTVEQELVIFQDADPQLLLPPAAISANRHGAPWVFPAPSAGLELRRGLHTTVVDYHAGSPNSATVVVTGPKAATDQILVFLNHGRLVVTSYVWFANLHGMRLRPMARNAAAATVTVMLPLHTPVTLTGVHGRVLVSGQELRASA